MLQNTYVQSIDFGNFRAAGIQASQVSELRQCSVLIAKGHNDLTDLCVIETFGFQFGKLPPQLRYKRGSVRYVEIAARHNIRGGL